MVLFKCDLCDQVKECLPKIIDGRQYDVCLDCWHALEDKLRGKGKPVKERETVYLPPVRVEPERPEKPEKPRPGEPPKIWGGPGVH